MTLSFYCLGKFLGGIFEPEATLDKMRSSDWDFVRTWCYFGQNEETRPRFCLNLMRLRTKREERNTILSELWTASNQNIRSHIKTKKTEEGLIRPLPLLLHFLLQFSMISQIAAAEFPARRSGSPLR